MQMLRFWTFRLLPNILFAAFLVNPAGAAVFTSGCSSQSACTLQELITGGVITVGGTRFHSWEIERNPGTVDFNQVLIEGVDDAGLDPGPGLRIQGGGELKITGTEELDLRFGFKAGSIYPNFRIRDNLLEITSSSTGGTGKIAVDENVFDRGFGMLAWTDVRVDPAFGDVRTGDTAEFGNQLSIFVEKDILLDGRAAADSASLDTFIQRFSQTTVPEPGLGLGLLMGVSILAVLGSRKHAQSIANHDPAVRETAVPSPDLPGGMFPCG